MTTYVVDTHALIWHLSNNPRLGKKAREILENESIPLVIPSIVLAEVKYLAHRRRFIQTLADVLATIGSAPRCTIYPADLSVVSLAPADLEIHDSIIVGTALALQNLTEEVAIITKDEAIISSGIVRTVW